MTKYYSTNDSILGIRLYITFERRKGKINKLQTKGRHNAQQLTVEGNPATATIIKTLKWIDENPN